MATPAMNLPNTVFALRWLTRDTFRQARTSGLGWVMLTASLTCILFCLSLGVEGGRSGATPDEVWRERLPPGDPEVAKLGLHPDSVETPQGSLSLGFGAFRIPFHHYADEILRYLELLLAGGVADTLGILLALVGTAGFVPAFLRPGSAAVLLAKPTPRWALLAGKFCGVLAFVLAQAGLFIGGTWLALALRTGIWDPTYLLAVPLLLVHFGVFFSFSLLLAVCTRSTVVSTVGSLLFWLVCWAVNYGHWSAVVSSQALAGGGSVLHPCLDAAYWVLPKPVDFGHLLLQGLHARGYFGQLLDLAALEKAQVFLPELSLLSSLLFAVAALGCAGYRFTRTDY